MKVHFYTDGNPVHDRCILAMHQGCPEADKQIRQIDDYAPSDVAVMFGMYKAAIPLSWPRGVVMAGQKALSRPTVVIDSGYVLRGDGPSDFYSVGLNGLNGNADFRNIDMAPDRWRNFVVEMTAYRKSGGHILVCGQVPWDASVQHVDFQRWAQETVDSLMLHTDRPIVYRPHPKAFIRPPDGAELAWGFPLSANLADCWAVVTFNSNTGVDAAIAGYPVYVDDVGSMVWPIAAGVTGNYESIEDPPLNPRAQWAADLAYTQWTPDEMRRGQTWNHLFR